MTINNESAKQAVKNTLKSKGFDLTKTSFTGDFIDVLVDTLLNEVKKASVKVPASGLASPSGAVTGQASGTIS